MIDKLINLDIFTILLLIWASMTVLLLIMRAKGAFDEGQKKSNDAFITSLDRKDQMVVDGKIYYPPGKEPRRGPVKK